MTISSLCISRPALTIVVSLIMVIIGVIGFLKLPLRWIPNITPPMVFIETIYTGADAQLVEREVTKTIEASLAGINGIESITSESRANESQISINFNLGQDVDAALTDVRANVERIRGNLPKDVLPPTVMKANPNHASLLFVSFYDAHFSQRQLTDYIEKYIAPTLETINGVGSVLIYGKQTSIMRISLLPEKMAASNITVDEIMTILSNENSSVPAGELYGKDRSYNLIADTTLQNAHQFNELILKSDKDKTIKLKDVANTSLTSEENQSSFRFNGKSAIAVGIVPQFNANPMLVEQEVQKKLKEIQRTLPQSMDMKVVYNQTTYIRAAIKNVYESFFEAIFFVSLVIYAFLGNVRATLIPIVTIPVCMISTFALLYFFHFSINTITLMAFVLAIGLVVDDSIVMLENINRHIESGASVIVAAYKGSHEIIFPIIAMTITLAAVYVPIAFTSGLMGVLFKEFTVTLAGAVIISGFISLTLSPMMCAKLLLQEKNSNTYQQRLHNFLETLKIKYRAALNFLIIKRIWALSVFACMITVGASLFFYLPSELAPIEEMNELNVYISAPRNASFDYTNAYVKQIEEVYKVEPDIESYLTQVGSFSASGAWQLIRLKPKNKRLHSTEELVSTLNERFSKLPGVRVFVSIPPPPLTQFSDSDEGQNIQLVLLTSEGYEQLQAMSNTLLDKIKGYAGFSLVRNRLKWNDDLMQININRDLAADLKVGVPSIVNTLSTLFAGRTLGKVNDVDVLVKLDKTALENPTIFSDLYVKNKNDTLLSLASLLSIKSKVMPASLSHYDRLRADTIYISLAPTFSMADAVNYLENTVKQLLPPNMKFKFTGEAKSFLESKGKSAFTLSLALLFIYLVLVAQFESFIDPFIILLTVPFAVIGSLVTLKLFGGSLNIYSQIGLITLIGLIAKHGILITDFANKLRAQGQSIHNAVIEASVLRLRPILMTTAAMVLGALPLAFAFGEGAQSMQQIGLVIVGGMLIGTMFSLIVVPIVYTYLAPLSRSNRIINM